MVPDVPATTATTSRPPWCTAPSAVPAAVAWEARDAPTEAVGTGWWRSRAVVTAPAATTPAHVAIVSAGVPPAHRRRRNRRRGGCGGGHWVVYWVAMTVLFSRTGGWGSYWMARRASR